MSSFDFFRIGSVVVAEWAEIFGIFFALTSFNSIVGLLSISLEVYHKRIMILTINHDQKPRRCKQTTNTRSLNGGST